MSASNAGQARQNIDACALGPLPQAIIDAYDAAWEAAKPVSDMYFRDYGSGPGKPGKFLQQYQARVPPSVM